MANEDPQDGRHSETIIANLPILTLLITINNVMSWTFFLAKAYFWCRKGVVFYSHIQCGWAWTSTGYAWVTTFLWQIGRPLTCFSEQDVIILPLHGNRWHIYNTSIVQYSNGKLLVSLQVRLLSTAWLPPLGSHECLYKPWWSQKSNWRYMHHKYL